MLFKDNFFSFLLLISLSIILKVNGDEDSPAVIIVGAGAAGIAAASKLFQNGIKNVKILEAEDRIGGRVFTTKFGDYVVDLGGQWVHGEEDNVSFEMAWPLGLLERGNISDRQDKMFDSSGKLLDQTVIDDLHNFNREVGQSVPNYAEKHKSASVGEHFKNELDKYLEKHQNWKENEKGLMLLLDMMEMAGYSAETWWDVSITSEAEFHSSAGDYLINWKERGYGTILDILMKRYPNPEEELPVVNNTILNAEVTSIDYSDENGKIAVKTKNGDTYSADHVIVTCSLGVLKDKHKTLFLPLLSEEKQKTIENLGYGGVGKIFLAFEEAWWPKETLGVGFEFLWKNKDLEMMENDPERSWLQGLVGFWEVEHKPRLLLGWLSGKHSRDMEKLSDEQVLKHCVEVIQRFLGNTYNVTTPIGIKRTMWNSNEHFKGTYSYRSVKTEAENVFPATLAEPIGKTRPMVLFAGEATNPHHFSTVHGAIETGWREADRIIKHHEGKTTVASGA